MEATSESTPARETFDPALFLAGRNLAVVTLNELTSEGEPRCSIEAEYRAGQDQCDALARAIEGLRAAPAAVIQGFAAVFTEIAGREPSSISANYFERLTLQQMRPNGGSGYAADAPALRGRRS